MERRWLTPSIALYCNWTALVGFSPTLSSMSHCDMTCVHHSGKSFLILSQKTYTFWFVFFKTPHTLHWPSRPRWTQQDAEKRAAECAECPISDTQVFGELWQSRVHGDLVNTEEGLFEHMYFGRIALAGDAVHKVSACIGVSSSIAEEMVRLCWIR